MRNDKLQLQSKPFLEERAVFVEQEVEKRAESMPLDAQNKTTLRRMLEKEYNDNMWEQRDYVYGHDEGEAPKGANW